METKLAFQRNAKPWNVSLGIRMPEGQGHQMGFIYLPQTKGLQSITTTPKSEAKGSHCTGAHPALSNPESLCCTTGFSQPPQPPRAH